MLSNDLSLLQDLVAILHNDAAFPVLYNIILPSGIRHDVCAGREAHFPGIDFYQPAAHNKAVKLTVIDRAHNIIFTQ